MNNDLISRSALLEEFQFRLPIDSERTRVIARCVEMARKIINEAPAVDAVEVCRCKGCKHTLVDGETVIYCEKWDRWEVPEDFFCGYGKRRNDHEAD